MATRRSRLGRGLAKFGLKLMIPMMVVVAAASAATFPSINMPGTQFPEIPSVDKATMQKAEASEVGAGLVRQHYKTVRKVSDEGLIAFLDEQERHVKISNPGPYVVFSKATGKVAAPRTDVSPDIIVDASNGVMTAVVQEYTNERATACFIVVDASTLTSQWVIIDQYLRGKPMPLMVPVNRKVAPKLRSGFPDTNCYIYPS